VENPPLDLSIFSSIPFHVTVSGVLKKYQTLEQVEKTKAKAARFAESVLEDSDLADALESESAESYAERRGIVITNPAQKRRTTMANGNNGGNGDDDYDFDGWTKQDCVDALNQVAQIADDAYDPMSSREDLAQAVGDIMDALSDGGDTGDEDDDQDDDPVER
jgi:hypothetical protein